MDHFEAEILSWADYLPFGLEITQRSFSSKDYKWGMGGQERDSEVGAGMYTAEYWEYDSRSARRWNTDPVVNENESPYATFNNNPIMMVDPDGDSPTNGGGDDPRYVHSKTETSNSFNSYKGVFGTTHTMTTTTLKTEFNTLTEQFTYTQTTEKKTMIFGNNGDFRSYNESETKTETATYKELTGEYFNPYRAQKENYLASGDYKNHGAFDRWNILQGLDGSIAAYAEYGPGLGRERGKYDGTVFTMLPWYNIGRGVEDIQAGDNWGWAKIALEVGAVYALGKVVTPLIGRASTVLTSRYIYNSRILGYDSYLLGIGRNGFKKGILNSGKIRMGWGFEAPTRSHVLRIGIGNNPRFHTPTTILGNPIHYHINLLKTRATF